MRQLIVFLIRKRLGLRRYERFQFTNQKTNAEYWFTETELLRSENGVIRMAAVSLNWLVNKDCSVMSIE